MRLLVPEGGIGAERILISGNQPGFKVDHWDNVFLPRLPGARTVACATLLSSQTVLLRLSKSGHVLGLYTDLPGLSSSFF